jgi:hypothetical protein
MKTATKVRQTSVTPVQPETEVITSRVTTVVVEQSEQKDPPAVRQAWMRLYDAIVGKRQVARRRGLVHQQ